MTAYPFVLISPSTRGLSAALTRHYLQTTKLPVYATYRSGSADDVKTSILSGIPKDSNVDSSRLNLLSLDLTSEKSIHSAAETLLDSLPHDKQSYIHTAFLTGGVLHAEKSPADLDFANIQESFQLNVISHLLLIKHFSRFLPPPSSSRTTELLSKWVHVSARVGSISDNCLGGWYSYRASKAALNQVIKTFDLHLRAKHIPAICVGVHPGTVKTDLSKPFWGSVREGQLFEPAFAAGKLVGVVESLDSKARGRIWDWAGKEVKP